MTLSTSIGTALDRVFASIPELAPFAKLKASGQDLRRFFHDTGQTQREVLFYRDKWWSKEDGGDLYLELSCLVPAVQAALHGAPQSLAAPDYSVPFSHFQYGTTEADPQRVWSLRSPADVTAFEEKMRTWLPSVALPWLAQFESTEGVVRFMREKKQFHRLAIVLASLGDAAGARDSMMHWLEQRPRQIERHLQRLAAAGLLSAQDEAFLLRVSIQSEEQYRQRLAGWIAGG
jgi:hypothetical protein